jgi:hypothetical protein
MLNEEEILTTSTPAISTLVAVFTVVKVICGGHVGKNAF